MSRKGGRAKGSKSGRPGPHTRRSAGRYGPGRPSGLRAWEMLTLSDHSDENGRLLLEDSAPESAIAKADRAGVPRATVVSEFADTPSRVSGLMNESAYEALRRDTAGILDGFAWLAGGYLQLHPEGSGRVRTLVDVSHLGLTMPLVLMGRAENPIPRHGRLPSYIASIFKASRGVFSAAVDLQNANGGEATVTPEEITSFADSNGHFRRAQTNRVCAAPTRLIQRTLAAMLTGEGADKNRSALRELIDFERLWEFYSEESRFNEALSNFGFVLKNVIESSAPADPSELFGVPVPDGDRLRPLGDFTEDILGTVNSAQARLNELLGRSRDAPRITFDELLKLI